MHYQYVVQFNVSTETQDAREAHDALIQHLHSWLDTGHVDAPSLETLTIGEGTSTALPVGARGRSEAHVLRWERAESADRLAHRVDVRVPLDGGHAFHVTRVTIASDSAQTSAGVRVVMATEVTDGWIAPAEPPYVRRPGIVRRIVSDKSLTVRRMRQRIDGQYENLRADREIAALAELLEVSERLPVLVIHPTGKDAWGTARALAQELPGLAQVVTLGNRDAWINFNRRVPEAAVPWGGARLVWADITHPQHYSFDSATIFNKDVCVSAVLRTLAPLSVAARGQNDLWYEVQRAERAERRAVAEQAMAQADASTDLQEQNDALRRSLRASRDEVELALNDAIANEAKVNEANEQIRLLETEVSGLQWFKNEYLRLQRDLPAAADTGEPDWTGSPQLKDDFEATFVYLEEASGGHIHFTSNARRSWRKSEFNFPDKMHDAVLNLAKASVAYYGEAQKDIGARREDWFLDEYGLSLALTDSSLSKPERPYQGEQLNFTPHVKLGDKKSPRDIGRIYFAFNDSRQRFVVHHVGVHDFG